MTAPLRAPVQPTVAAATSTARGEDPGRDAHDPAARRERSPERRRPVAVRIITTVFLLACAVVFTYPFLWLLSASLKPRGEIVITASVLTTIPMIVLFFLAQRHFVEGVATTGTKG